MNITDLTLKILAGRDLDEEEAHALEHVPDMALFKAAEHVTRTFVPPSFDSCSIINVRSGRCPEDCRWCAQSVHYETGCGEHGVESRGRCLEAARLNKAAGVRRFSLVASGRTVRGRDLDEICATLREIKEKVGISTCASLGLLDAEGMKKLYDSGVRRYHCNLETAPSFFPRLCTTHTVEDKLATIGHALELGMEVCSGGIIGMGESESQRIEFALALRKAHPVSIPVNILNPIPGTPLQDVPLISDREITRALAYMRLIHPCVQIRWAGGRKRLGRDVQLQCLRTAVNGGIVGDLLTTVGSSVEEDRALTGEAGYEF